ncbi:MAG TPA: protein kinase, partial [Roseiflexaceae bacterium]
SPYILDYGEWLGDIEIIRPITVLRSSALYEARHNKQKVLLKVAHPGPEHTERLKREATFLRDIASKKERAASFPLLIPPYANTTIEKDPYGRAILREHLLFFCLFEHFEGDPLRDVLIKNPQLWIFHVGWIMISLASAVAFLQSKGMYHYGLSPETVLVRFSEDSPAPQTLLFDLGIASDRKQLKESWYPALVSPAYTAPELIGATVQPDYATDVYGLGLVLYELLVGSPPFPYKLHSDAEVYDAVRYGHRVRMSRVEDVKEVAEIAVTAVSAAPERRQKSAADVAEALLKTFGAAPVQRKRSLPSPRTTLIVTATLLAIAFLITVGVTFSSAWL